MKREIEKLNLTEKQYRLHGRFMTVISVFVFMSVFLIIENSVLLSMVSIIIGFEFLCVGYIFNKVAKEISCTNDEAIIKRHKDTAKNRKTSLGISFASILLIVLLSVPYCFVLKDVEEQDSVVETMAVVDESVISEQNEVSQEVTTQMVVYATQTGERYHYRNNCSNGNYFEITLDDALAKGLTPCSKCVG